MKSDKSRNIQNRFTKYLVIAVERRRIKYLQKLQQRANNEVGFPDNVKDEPRIDFEELHNRFIVERTEYAAEHWEKMQEFLQLIDETKLVNAITKLKEKERILLFGRIMGELTFDELGKKIGVTSKQAQQAFFYVLRKLRKELKK